MKYLLALVMTLALSSVASAQWIPLGKMTVPRTTTAPATGIWKVGYDVGYHQWYVVQIDAWGNEVPPYYWYDSYPYYIGSRPYYSSPYIQTRPYYVPNYRNPYLNNPYDRGRDPRRPCPTPRKQVYQPDHRDRRPHNDNQPNRPNRGPGVNNGGNRGGDHGGNRGGRGGDHGGDHGGRGGRQGGDHGGRGGDHGK